MPPHPQIPFTLPLWPQSAEGFGLLWGPDQQYPCSCPCVRFPRRGERSQAHKVKLSRTLNPGKGPPGEDGAQALMRVGLATLEPRSGLTHGAGSTDPAQACTCHNVSQAHKPEGPRPPAPAQEEPVTVRVEGVRKSPPPERGPPATCTCDGRDQVPLLIQHC